MILPLKNHDFCRVEKVGCHFTAMHRKQEDRAGQFLNPQATVLFGTPIICALNNTDVMSSDSDGEFCIGNDEFCIGNDEFCIKNDEFCIKDGEEEEEEYYSGTY